MQVDTGAGGGRAISASEPLVQVREVVMNTRFAVRVATAPPFHGVPRAGFIAAALLLLAISARPGLAQAPPTPHHPGHWTGLQTWSYEAVHLALMPGTGSYHSQIVWWHGSPATDTQLQGGVWGWNWSAGSDQCASFGSFTALSVGKPQFDVFCAGTTHLADGRAAVLGGTSAIGEVGVRNAAYFDPINRTWTEVANPMAARRWYPSAHLTQHGAVTAYSGSSYGRILSWGGTTTPGGAGQAQGDLHRLQLTEASAWDPKIPHPNTSAWPDKRYGHSLTAKSATDAPLMFGGRDINGQYRNDVWWLGVHAEPLQSDHRYEWQEQTGPGAKPGGRMEHCAVVLGDESLVVYGGRDGSQVFSDVWRHFKNSLGQWVWEALTQEGDPTTGLKPGARFGQAAIYQLSTVAPVRDRALVYGGATTVTGQLADNDVWELTVDLQSQPRKAKWRKLVVEGSTKPLARYDHAMAADPYLRRRNTNTSSPCVWRMFVSGGRGVFGSDSLSSELWQLWDMDVSAPADSVAWTSLNPASGPVPSARAGHSLTYDGRHYLVLLGGDTGASQSSKQIWEMKVQCPHEYGGSCEACQVGYDYAPTWNEPITPADTTEVAGHAALLSGGWIYARTPESLAPATGQSESESWTSVNAPLLQEWYPFMFTIAGGPRAGKVFNAGPSVAGYLLDPIAPSWSAFPDTASGFRGGSAVLYRPDRVMKCGSRDTDAGTAARTTKHIALDHPYPAWAASTDMDSGRVNHNLTLLPSGEVLVNGGTELVSNTGSQGRSRGLLELWRPPDATFANGVWYGGSGTGALERTTVARDYHSVALLLPDGRVLTGSGEVSANRKDAQIYCPPYLFNANGSAATRPQISSAPASVTYGESFVIGKPAADTIASVCLIRPGAVTHGFNQDQRYIPLSFVALAGDTALRTAAPLNGRIAPPGDYLLFILNLRGTPAVAKWIRLGQCPTIPCDTGSPPQVTELYADIVTSNEVWLVWPAPGDDTPALGGLRPALVHGRARERPGLRGGDPGLGRARGPTPGLAGQQHGGQPLGVHAVPLRAQDPRWVVQELVAAEQHGVGDHHLRRGAERRITCRAGGRGPRGERGFSDIGLRRRRSHGRACCGLVARCDLGRARGRDPPHASRWLAGDAASACRGPRRGGGRPRCDRLPGAGRSRGVAHPGALPSGSRSIPARALCASRRRPGGLPGRLQRGPGGARPAFARPGVRHGPGGPLPLGGDG